jgi:hypothetical protein
MTSQKWVSTSLFGNQDTQQLSFSGFVDSLGTSQQRYFILSTFSKLK